MKLSAAAPLLLLAAGVGLLAIAVVAAFVLLAGGDSEPTPILTAPAEPGLLIYLDPNGLVALDTESGELHHRAVPANFEQVLAAECTRDGARIAYLKQDLKSGARTVLVEAGAQPDAPIQVGPFVQGIGWSPDGERLALVEQGATDTQTYELKTLDPDSGKEEVLASEEGLPGPPRWSPDGARIAFHSLLTPRVYVYELAAPDSPARSIGPPDVKAYDPEWAPDGSHLLFIGLDQKQVFQIFSLDLATGEPTQLTNSPFAKGRPRFAVDGSALAVNGTVFTPAVSGRPAAARHQFAVWLIKPDGTGEEMITDITLDASLLGWCARGPWLNGSWTVGQ